MYYIMSDIHGCYDQMIKALEHWDSDKEHLIIMGDMIDRGPDSLKVVHKAMELTDKHPEKVTVLKGNHEQMLLEWVYSPEELLSFYYTEQHEATLKSFLGDDYRKYTKAGRGLQLLKHFKKELQFLRRLELFEETENIVFVHAGLNLEAADWRDCHNDLIWIREKFIHSKKVPRKRVFFGHTPTSLIRNEENNRFWESPCGMKIGIDGGVSMGGHLNSLKVNGEGGITAFFEIS